MRAREIAREVHRNGLPFTWQIPRDLAPDVWCYFTEKGIEVWMAGGIVCVVPLRIAESYVNSVKPFRRRSQDRHTGDQP